MIFYAGQIVSLDQKYRADGKRKIFLGKPFLCFRVIQNTFLLTSSPALAIAS